MRLVFRWYGRDDPVTLRKIRQIPGMTGVVSALYDLEPGVAWPEDRLSALRDEVEAAGLSFRVVESIPIREDVKLGDASRDEAIDAFMKSVRAVGKVLGELSPDGDIGKVVVTYNFMPAFDWLRTDLEFRNRDGSTSLAYRHAAVESFDPLSDSLDLPGWLGTRTREEQARLVARYREMTDEDLWKNFEYFLKAVVPVADESSVVLAVHPDDPPWPVFGMPRIVTGAAAFRRIYAAKPSGANGICFCTGSLGAAPENDLSRMAEEFAPRIRFAHLRNVKRWGDRNFAETAHSSDAGSLDMEDITAALTRGGFHGYVRPDHGRMIWDESGRPGYGLYDRALGSQYLMGLFEGGRGEEAREAKRNVKRLKRRLTLVGLTLALVVGAILYPFKFPSAPPAVLVAERSLPWNPALNREQSYNACAAYSAMAYLYVVYGARFDPEEIDKDMPGRKPDGFTYPQGLVDYLKGRGAPASLYWIGFLDDKRRLEWIKGQVASGTPVILVVGSTQFRHYVTVLGYDARSFRIYDSIRSDDTNESRPGNADIVYDDLLAWIDNARYGGVRVDLAITR